MSAAEPLGLASLFDMVGGFDSNSASKSDIWEAIDKRTQKPVIFKAFILEHYEQRPDGTLESVRGKMDDDLGLMYHEIRTYKSLREQVILPYNARNILCAVGEGDFSSSQLYQFIKNSPHVKLSDNAINQNLLFNAKFLLDVGRAREKRSSITTTHRDSLPPLQRADLQIELTNGSKIRLDKPIRYGCIITPKLKQTTLGKLVEEDALSAKEFANYLFIVMVTIWIMASKGVNQNDLHWWNILLDDTYFGPNEKHKRKYLMVYNDRVILIDNKFIPYIYDFDRAAVARQIVPPLVGKKYLSKGGNCPRFHPLRDFAKTVCNIYKSLEGAVQSGNAALRAIQDDALYKLVKSDFLRDGIRNSTQSCWMTSGDTSLMCSDSTLDQGLARPEEMVEWCLGKTGYKSFTLDELRAVTSARSLRDSPEYAKIRGVLDAFRSDIPSSVTSEEDYRAYLTVNTQFVCQRNKVGTWHKSPKAMQLVLDQLFTVMQ
jgi:hypothetical protein